MNLKALIVTFATVYFVLSQLYRRTSSKITQVYQQAEISLKNKTITLTVLKDTGNELYDPISNLPVLVIEKNLAKELISELDAEQAEDDMFDTFCRLNAASNLAGKFRLIPYQSISGKDILLGFIPDHLMIDGKQTQMIVAYTNLKLSTNNQYQGIC